MAPVTPWHLKFKTLAFHQHVEYTVKGRFTRSQKVRDTIAEAASIAFLGANTCFSKMDNTEPDHNAANRSFYVAQGITSHQGVVSMDIYELDNMLQAYYVATVLFKLRKTDSFIRADAIMFNKNRLKRIPSFPPAPAVKTRSRAA